MKGFHPIIDAEDDGLEIPQVGSWALHKYNLVGRYCDVFTTSMRNKWDNLVYLDLFSASGLAKIRNTKKIVYSSPLISLSIPHKFTNYIFCEKDERLYRSLNKRLERFPNEKITALNCDSNLSIETIIASVPKFSKQNSGLSFAFVDPLSLDLHFDIIRKLSDSIRVDFLILLALHMDGKRNFASYFEAENHKIDQFLGKPTWRDDLRTNPVDTYDGLVKYLAKQYRSNMESLGYRPTESFHQVRSDSKNLPLYYLAYFSKHDLGNKFWKEIQKYSSPQQGLF